MFRTKCKEHDHSDFYQFLQMEPTHKNNDCYFFYYSTCTKGDNCAFRHEPSALGCESMCQYWQQGNCLNEHCNFRHMELKKNRKSIPCFWESQRGGCKKPHCPFLHTSGRVPPNADPANPIKTAEVTSKPVTQEWSNRPDDGKYDGSGTESDQGRGSSEAGSFIGSPAVDPLIVNFDEESDSEMSAPSPVKAPHTSRVPYCKTYEEIRLEEIQAESAAYYSYEPDDYLGGAGGGKEKRTSTARAARRALAAYPRETTRLTAAMSATRAATYSTTAAESPGVTDFTILTLEEIRRRKAARRGTLQDPPPVSLLSSETPEVRRTSAQRRKREPDVCRENVPRRDEADENFLKNAIKTLAELKASTGEDKIVPGSTKKRKLEENEETTTRAILETRRDADKISKVPPVRLRRSPKRFARDTRNLATRDTNPEDVIIPSDNNSTRNEEIEIRLCDSSTSDDIHGNVETTVNTSRDNDSNASIIATSEDLKLEQLCDTNLSSNEDDYLAAVDPASEDILKDIDALLTEKSTV